MHEPLPLRGVSAVVADDHFPTRQRLRLLLESAGCAVASAADAATAVSLADRLRPDLCLLDINMPGNGIAAAAGVRDVSPGTVVVMLTVSRNDADLFAALQSGATGYLLKDTELSAIPEQLRRALDGEALLSGRLAARVVEEFRERGRRKRILGSRTHAELSRREWQVLELLAEHLSTSEIADRLFLEPVTVRTHVSRILHKLQVPTRQAAVRLLQERR
jgi:two-component system nitrate/nitrite response regulator NarL